MSAVCGSCGAAIVWAKTSNDKPMPLDAEPSSDGNIQYAYGRAIYLGTEEREASNEPLYVSHFATCPQASQHRRRA
jgi:hypothetical protein